MTELDASIAAWRTAITRGPAVTEADAEELEGHLREQLEELMEAGLTPDEALQIALQRLGRTDQLTAEYAREHSDRMWKQFVLPAPAATSEGSRPLLTMIVFALLGAAILQAARLIAGVPLDMQPWFYRSLPLLVIPVLAAYLAFTRRLPLWHWGLGAAVVAALAAAINLFPFEAMNSQTEVLAVLHLPVLLWCLVGAAYLAAGARLMDFVRFSGEWAIYFVLLCLGGGVLLGLTTAILTPLAPMSITEVVVWVMPSGGTAAVIVAAWLVEAKKSLIESVAPVLAAIFTPLFALMLAVASIVYLVAGIGVDFDRDLLMVFDGMLIVVLALVLYGIAARTPGKPAGALDVMRFIAVAAALLLDLLVLGSMLARVAEFGFTPNRVAALGLNVLLVLSLAGTAWLLARMLWQRRNASGLERWQLRSLPVFAAWAGVVVLVLPPLFGFA